MSRVVFVDYIIKRKDVQSNPDVLYLFGDNILRRGLGGQAKEMRGEPNTCGIRTKLYPNNDLKSFMNDNQFLSNAYMITEDIDLAIKLQFRYGYKSVIVPPMGVGLAKLPEKAPKTYEWLQSELKRLERTINQYFN